MRAFIDSDVLIDYLQGRPEAAAELANYECCISLLSWMEVMIGVIEGTAAETVLRGFLGTFRIFPVNTAVAERAVRLRRKYRLKLPDAIIWATAQEDGCLLVTRNTKDFPNNDAGIHFPY